MSNPILNDLKKLKQMLEDIVAAPNKSIGSSLRSEAETFSKRFEQFADNYELGKFRQSISYAYKASGQMNDKEHWRSAMVSQWYRYESAIRWKIEKLDDKNIG